MVIIILLLVLVILCIYTCQYFTFLLYSPFFLSSARSEFFIECAHTILIVYNPKAQQYTIQKSSLRFSNTQKKTAESARERESTHSHTHTHGQRTVYPHPEDGQEGYTSSYLTETLRWSHTRRHPKENSSFQERDEDSSKSVDLENDTVRYKVSHTSSEQNSHSNTISDVSHVRT